MFLMLKDTKEGGNHRIDAESSFEDPGGEGGEANLIYIERGNIFPPPPAPSNQRGLGASSVEGRFL